MKEKKLYSRPLKIYFFFPEMPEKSQQSCYSRQYYQKIINDLIDSDKLSIFTKTTSPEEADIIILMEPHQTYKCETYAQYLLSLDIVKAFPEKVFVCNSDDKPQPLLPGVYECLPKEKFDFNLHRSGSPLILDIEDIKKFAKTENLFAQNHQRYLFSFRGTRTSKLREDIFNLQFGEKESACIVETPMDKFFKHKEDKAMRVSYITDILSSCFVLCPRGFGSSENERGGGIPYRFYETLALGKVPVVISDSWVRQEGPSWNAFSIQIPESEISKIPEILRAFRTRADVMAKNALAAYQEWFSQDVALSRMVDSIHELSLHRKKSKKNRSYFLKSFQKSYKKIYNPPSYSQRLRNKSSQLRKKLSRFSGPMHSDNSY